jgi:hypothetical protein
VVEQPLKWTILADDNGRSIRDISTRKFNNIAMYTA